MSARVQKGREPSDEDLLQILRGISPEGRAILLPLLERLAHGDRSAAQLASPIRWELETGSFPVRASCPCSPRVPLGAVGLRMARCRQCKRLFALCGASFGSKGCALVDEHAGRDHVSASGSAWPR